MFSDIQSILSNPNMDSFIYLRNSSIIFNNSIVKNIMAQNLYFIRALSDVKDNEIRIENCHFENISNSMKPFIYISGSTYNIFSNNYIVSSNLST